MTLAEQVGVGLTVAFSEATQPLTLTGTVDTADDGFTIFCAIATTTSTAFDDEEAALKSGSERKPPRSTTNQRSDSGQNASHERPSSNRVQPERPRSAKRLEFGRASQQAAVILNSASVATRGRVSSLFLPGGSSQGPSGSQTDGVGPSRETASPESQMPSSTQKVRMSQKEVMDVSGFGDVDPEKLWEELDDAEEEEEMQGKGFGDVDQERDQALAKGNAQTLSDGGEGRAFEPAPDILEMNDRSVLPEETMDIDGEEAQQEQEDFDSSDEIPSSQRDGEVNV